MERACDQDGEVVQYVLQSFCFARAAKSPTLDIFDGLMVALAMLALIIAHPGFILRGRTPVDEIAMPDTSFGSGVSSESFSREQELKNQL